MASIPRDTSDIGYRLRALESRAGVLERATGLNSASIGAGGMRVRDGGSIQILGGGSLEVRQPGSMKWTYEPSGLDGMFWGTLQPATDFHHGFAMFDPAGDGRIWFARLMDGKYVAEFGTTDAPIETVGADAQHILLHGHTQTIITSDTGPTLVDSGATGQLQLGAGANASFLTNGNVITSNPANVWMSAGGWIGRTSWTPTSSRRYKQDIEAYAPGPDAVDRITPVTYRLRSDVEAGGVYPPDVEPPSPRLQRPGEPAPEPEPVEMAPAPVYVGIIAEDLHEAGLGEFVTDDSHGRPEQVQYDRLVAVLIPAVQDLRARVTELEAQRR